MDGAARARAYRAFFALFLALASAGATRGQATAFTYQGRLTEGGSPANGSYDLQFTLWDALAGGTQQPQAAPATLTKPAVVVTGGVFSVLLDFGVSAFPGADRFLEVGVRPAGGAGAFTILSPRQQISSTPYALRTLRAAAADSLSAACIGCVSDSQIASVAATKLTGTIPASSLPAGGSFIQNSTAVQAGASFNISGNGVVGARLGVGTSAPNFPFEVNTPLGSFGFVHSTPSLPSLGLRPIRVGSFAGTDRVSGAAGGWLGTLSNDPLHFFVNNGAPSMTVDTNGNVGVGTTNPGAKLEAVATSSSVSIGVVGRATIALNGIGVAGGASGAGAQGVNGFVTGTRSTGVIGTSTGAGGIGVEGNSTSGTGVRGSSSSGFAMFAAGNAGQDIGRGGWVKALLYVTENGTVERCYNSQSGASGTSITTDCGFRVQNSLGHYTITFPFTVSDRFASVTPSKESGGHQVGANVAYPRGGFGGVLPTNRIEVFTFYLDVSKGTSATSPTNAPFTLVVY